jgi:hypothetical protein
MDRVLANLERAGCTISGAKLQFYMPKLRIVGFICDALGRHSNTFKVIKIMKWPPFNDIIEARAFVRVAVYYKVFIKNFAIIAAPIYSLIKKKIRFAWNTEQQLTINTFKMAIIIVFTLVILNYSPEAREIILTVDFNLKRWGATLFQIVSKYRYPSRYKSDFWTEVK